MSRNAHFPRCKWQAPVFPVTQEAEEGGLLETQELDPSLDDIVRPYLRINKQTNKPNGHCNIVKSFDH